MSSAGLAEELMAQRAEERVGEIVEVLVEEDLGDGATVGRAAHQAPEVDGTSDRDAACPGVAVGDLIRAQVAGAKAWTCVRPSRLGRALAAAAGVGG